MIAFYGCWGEPGHYLWLPGKQLLSDRDIKKQKLRIPPSAQLDGSSLFLPLPEAVGKGALTHLPALDITILAWWGSPFDTRGEVNNAIISTSIWGETEMWNQFQEDFPELSKKLERPSIVMKTFRWQGS